MSDRLLEDGSLRLLEDGASVRLLEDVSGGSPPVGSPRLYGELIPQDRLYGELA